MGHSVGSMCNSWFWLRSWCRGSWSQAPRQAPCWQRGAYLGFSLPLSLPLPYLRCLCLSQNKEINFKNIIKLSILKQGPFIISISIGREAGSSLAGSCRLGVFASLQSRCQLGLPPSETWLGMEGLLPSSLTRLLCSRLQLLTTWASP